MKHQAPHSKHMIKELIEMGKYKTAAKYCDENEAFYESQAEEMRDLWRDVQIAQMGVTVTDDNRVMLRASVSK